MRLTPDAPANWTRTRLRHVVRLNPSKSEMEDLDPDREVSFLPMEAIGEDGSTRLDATRPLSEVQSGYSYFRDEDVVVAKITPCFENGKGALVRGLHGGIGFGTTELIVVRPLRDRLCSEYLQWIFQSSEFRKLGEGFMYGAGGQKRVPDDFVRDFRLALPPLTEQKSITSFLDRETSKIDVLVGEQRRLVELLKEKRQAVISHAVTKGINAGVKLKLSGLDWLGKVPEHWSTGRLKHRADVRGRIGFRGYAAEDLVGEGEGALALGGANLLSNGGVSLDKPTYINWQKFEESPEIEVFRGDILIGQRGTCGRVALVDREIGPATINPSLVVLKGLTLEPRFAKYWLSGDLVQKTFDSYLSKTAIPMLSQEQIGNVPIVIPPQAEQEQIADYLDASLMQLTVLAGEAEHASALLQERRAALISAAVTGKIDVQQAATDQEYAA